MAEANEIKVNMSIENALEEYGTIIWNCKGRSMKPLIRETIDHVVIKKPDRWIKPFDIVMYAREEAGSDIESDPSEEIAPKSDYVLHRVIRRRGDELIILGDNCVTYEHIPRDRVVGVMSGLIRNGRTCDLTGPGYHLYLNLWVRPHRLRIAFTRAWSKLRRFCTKARKRSRKD